jgi:hypothetical protein
MNRRIMIIAMMFAMLAISGIWLTLNEKNGGLDKEQVQIVETKTYEQGLWDGFNGAFRYLDYTGQIKDTLHIEITIADSILHAKK